MEKKKYDLAQVLTDEGKSADECAEIATRAFSDRLRLEREKEIPVDDYIFQVNQ